VCDPFLNVQACEKDGGKSPPLLWLGTNAQIEQQKSNRQTVTGGADLGGAAETCDSKFSIIFTVSYRENGRKTNAWPTVSLLLLVTVGFCFFSLLWGLLCSLPHTLGSTSSASGTPFTTLVGLGMYSVGFLIIETTTPIAIELKQWLFFKLATRAKIQKQGVCE